MGFKEWIIPQDRVFYDLLDHYALHVRKTVVFFDGMLRDWTDLEDRRQELKGLENEADEISHEIFHRLGRTFITPLDREDIVGLAHTLDDIVDYLDATGNRMVLYELPAANAPMKRFTELLKAQVDEIVPAIKALRKASTRSKIKPHTIEIHRLENEADRLLNRSIAELFKTNDPVQILKFKDVYENLETATDRCEDVADILNDILRKQG